MEIILRDEGIDRHYPCNNKYDAIRLFDILCRAQYSQEFRIEMWEGDKMVGLYDIRFDNKI